MNKGSRPCPLGADWCHLLYHSVTGLESHIVITEIIHGGADPTLTQPPKQGHERPILRVPRSVVKSGTKQERQMLLVLKSVCCDNYRRVLGQERYVCVCM